MTVQDRGLVAGRSTIGNNQYMDLGYWSRVGSTLVAHPLETLERMRQRAEMWRYARDDSVDYRPDPEWELTLREWLDGADANVDADDRCSEILGDVERALPSFPRGHDADPALARAIWRIVSGTRATKVVETGVARGVTSRFVLEALKQNGHGHLWSIDLPPILSGFHDSVGAAVPDRLRDRWTYIRGSSRWKLGRLLRALEPIDVFIQDSLGTPPTVSYEISLAFDALRPGGWMVVNGVDRSRALADFLAKHPHVDAIIAPAAAKAAHSDGGVIHGQFCLIRGGKTSGSGESSVDASGGRVLGAAERGITKALRDPSACASLT
jgi:Methyltransferase domain